MTTLSDILYRWIFYRCLPWAIIICISILGWHWGGWLGFIGGGAVGLVLAVVTWYAFYYLAFSRRLRRRHLEVSKLSTDVLKEIVANAKSPDLGFAMGELNKRGFDARPSVESLCSLLLAGDSNSRGFGMVLLQATYPDLWHRFVFAERWSNLDPPDVWRERVNRIRADARQP